MNRKSLLGGSDALECQEGKRIEALENSQKDDGAGCGIVEDEGQGPGVGESPVRERKIRQGYAEFSRKDAERIQDVLSSRRYSPGPYCRQFEDQAAKVVGSQHSVFVNSGTDALRLSLLAMKELYGWEDGDSVCVPALTFVASVNVVLQAGLNPYFVDVDPYDFNMNPDNLDWRLSVAKHQGVKAIMPVHLFGKQANMERIKRIALKYDLRIIEDSCESIGNQIVGDVLCFSTYQSHIIATGVGGMACTDDDDLHELIRSYANHGRNIAYLPGYREPHLSKELLQRRFQFDRIGYSCRPTEFEAALGLGQIERLRENLESRLRNAFLIRELLGDLDEFVLPMGPNHSFMMFPIAIRQESKLDRDELCLDLERKGIETRPLMPITNQPCYEGLVREDEFPVAKWLNAKGFYVPCHPGMSEEDAQFIGLSIRDFALSHLTKL